MTEKNVFEFDDYKAYLLHSEQVKSAFIRGYRTRLAEAIGCNNTFISQVLNTSANFSLEQGLAVSRYLSLPPSEESYFLLLIEHARAGTEDLKDYFNKQIREKKEKFLNIKERVKNETHLNVEAQAIYYSQWYYAAVHMLVTIPEFRTPQKIAKYLRLNTALIQKTVTFLVSQNLLIEKNGELLPGSSYLHLEKNSPFIARHHSNWRLAAMDALSRDNAQEIHYSTVSTLSRKDCEHLRAHFTQVIQDYVKTVSHSKEEMMWVFNLDFFNLGES
jgi:uncharacterized protein (TIGR02147 family)